MSLLKGRGGLLFPVALLPADLDLFPFEPLCAPNHAASRFAERNAVFPPTLGRGALCRHLAFPLFPRQNVLGRRRRKKRPTGRTGLGRWSGYCRGPKPGVSGKYGKSGRKGTKRLRAGRSGQRAGKPSHKAWRGGTPCKMPCRGNGERGKTCRSASGQGISSVTGGFSRTSPPAGSIRRPAIPHPWRHYQCRRPGQRGSFCLPQGGTGPARKENFFPVRAFSVGTALHVKPYGLTFREKTRFFRSLSAGRRCAAASRSAFFKGKALYPAVPCVLFSAKLQPHAPRRARTTRGFSRLHPQASRFRLNIFSFFREACAASGIFFIFSGGHCGMDIFSLPGARQILLPGIVAGRARFSDLPRQERLPLPCRRVISCIVRPFARTGAYACCLPKAGFFAGQETGGKRWMMPHGRHRAIFSRKKSREKSAGQ